MYQSYILTHKLLKEASGNINDALLDYDQAQRLTSAEIDWQPQFLIAFAKQKQGTTALLQLNWAYIAQGPLMRANVCLTTCLLCFPGYESQRKKYMGQ